MINVAIVEDDQEWSAQLTQYVKQYGKEKDLRFAVTSFNDGTGLLFDFKPTYDIIFLDIEMKHSNGMEVAQKIREVDESVIIIFVTNMAQYALKGYTVNALDFIVKPAQYYDIAYRLDKAVRLLNRNKRNDIVLAFDRQYKKVKVSDIYYVEVVRHHLVYHTAQGNFEVRSSLSAAEQQLNDGGFCKCNSGFLINLRYVTDITGNEVIVAGDRLLISRAKRAELLQKLMLYIGA